MNVSGDVLLNTYLRCQFKFFQTFNITIKEIQKSYKVLKNVHRKPENQYK